MNRFQVAAGILRDADGRILITERLGGGPFHGMWEFPGGKIATNESPEQALARELAEELGIELRDVAHFMHLEHDYPDRSVSIDFFMVSAWKNEPEGLEGQQLRWVEAGSLADQDLLPADVPVIEALQQMAS
jgi:8-oxo-dGTP diphosphatase